MPPRRSHKKSRNGCQRCKARKIKCDEAHPKCGNCRKHGVLCDFEKPEDVLKELQAVNAASIVHDAARGPATTSAPQHVPGLKNRNTPQASSSSASGSIRFPAVTPLCRPPPAAALSQTTPAKHRLLEMRLIHQYATDTCRTFTFTAPHTQEIWRDLVPRMAFSGAQHLVDSILAVAALHLRHLNPDDPELVRASHAYMASSLAQYGSILKQGIEARNAETLFLTSTMIAFQATATRLFTKDENTTTVINNSAAVGSKRGWSQNGAYSIPISWFHSFQGVKTITGAAWPWLRSSSVAHELINSQAALQLDLSFSKETFFGHLLDGLEEELAALDTTTAHHIEELGLTGPFGVLPSKPSPDPGSRLTQSTRQAYQHAVAVMNWAHKIPHLGPQLSFPATVSRRFIELVEERRPRALAILANFFGLVKSLDNVWWLHGMAKREVLGVVSLFNNDALGPGAYARWWPHLEWAIHVAMCDKQPIPPEIWGADCTAEGRAHDDQNGGLDYYQHIDTIARSVAAAALSGP